MDSAWERCESTLVVSGMQIFRHVTYMIMGCFRKPMLYICGVRKSADVDIDLCFSAALHRANTLTWTPDLPNVFQWLDMDTRLAPFI